MEKFKIIKTVSVYSKKKGAHPQNIKEKEDLTFDEATEYINKAYPEAVKQEDGSYRIKGFLYPSYLKIKKESKSKVIVDIPEPEKPKEINNKGTKVEISTNKRLIVSNPDCDDTYYIETGENGKFYITSQNGYNGFEGDGFKHLERAIMQAKTFINNYFEDKMYNTRIKKSN
jgi:hypothetical protein